jgi:mono/diheme cytochrome c family protein
MKKAWISMFAVAAFGLAAQPALAGEDHELGEKLFKKKCAMCHKVEKKKVGPAVVDMSTDEAVLHDVISNGRNMMPGFSKKFSAAEIDAVVAYLRSKQK